MELVRKKILISGASSGIGKATALRFAQEGWDVCLNARREELLMQIKTTLPAGNHMVCAGDYSDPAVAQRIAEQIARTWGGLDALANCAGIFSPGHAIDQPLDDWRYVLDLMLYGGVQLTRLAVPLMRDGGRIIHVTSIHGERAEAGAASYSMAKAALNPP